MTFIVAGKLNDSCFLMSDSIAKDSKTGKKSFAEKIRKLTSSSNVFYAITGNNFFALCIAAYDEWQFINNRTSDFLYSDESMRDLVKFIDKMLESHPEKKAIDLNANRIFFINENDVCYYEIHFTKHLTPEESQKRNLLKPFQLIDSCIDYSVIKIPDNFSENVEASCSRYLIDLSNNKVDFKNRLAFIQLFHDGRKPIFKRHFKYSSDLIAYYNVLDYETIDDPNFKWTL